jgi:chromosomal replication initiation ATPase DnaA
MFGTTVILRKPKDSEMALSNQVKNSVSEAVACLRDALAFAARAEHPITINTLSDILMRLESLEHIDEIMEKFGKIQNQKIQDSN